MARDCFLLDEDGGFTVKVPGAQWTSVKVRALAAKVLLRRLVMNWVAGEKGCFDDRASCLAGCSCREFIGARFVSEREDVNGGEPSDAKEVVE